MTETFDFLGVFIAIKGSLPRDRVVDALSATIEMSALSPWKRIQFSRLGGPGDERIDFSEAALKQVLDLADRAQLETLFLMGPEPPHPDWWRAHTDAPFFMAVPRFSLPNPGIGRLDELGPLCAIILNFPRQLFDASEETDFQRSLLKKLEAFTAEHIPSYWYANCGRGDKRPMTFGGDRIFQSSRTSVPVSAFDTASIQPWNLYDEYVRSAFWANYLNPTHVRKLGGLEKIRSIHPYRVVALHNGGAVIVLAPSPFDLTSATVPAYQAFRSFLEPIRVETGDEWVRAMRSVKGGT